MEIDPEVKAQAIALLKQGEMRVAEVADLLGQSRQLVATWWPGARDARRKWCARRWNEALKGVDKAAASRFKSRVRRRRRK
jgi:transposase-like protein